MSKSIYRIQYKGFLEIPAKTAEEAEEKAMEQLPTDAQLVSTDYEGEFKPDC